MKDNQYEELKKFHKSYFNIDNIVSTASELKYTNELKSLLLAEISNPSENFVRLLTKQIYSSIITAKVLEQFTILTKRSFNQLINDLITERLKSALKKETEQVEKVQEKPAEEESIDKSNKIITTAEEIETFFIVKSILRTKISSDRIVYRDAQSYFAIILDDNNRKPICRLYLDGKRKFIGLFDENKKENKHELTKIDDIYLYADQLYKIVDIYLA